MPQESTDLKNFIGSRAAGGLTPQAVSWFQDIILENYRRQARDLPWRHTTDPYRILVSEVMLQQTQVERVTKKYPAFLAAFPTLPDLAEAPLHKLLEVWQGMGYNRRAVALRKCAQKVIQDFSGTIPRDVDVLVTLPSIGRATACSIAAFAFNAPVIFIETNIRRVFIHFFFSDSTSVSDDEILFLVKKTLRAQCPRIWYWALMDYGAELKKNVPNPNRKSAHYMKQSKFNGSDREIRGLILKTLIQNPMQNEMELTGSIPSDQERVTRIIDTLVKEGFLTRDGQKLTIKDV